jgi:hypothetical protein
MVYVNIPYVAENDRLDASVVGKELSALAISESAKYQAFEAIYNKRPRGVDFSDSADARKLENLLYCLGVPFRRTAESDYKYELLP